MFGNSSMRVLSSAVCAAGLAISGAAQAGVIYNGGEFSLSLLSQTGLTYQFEYEADLTNWTDPTQAYIGAVNFKPDTGMVPVAYDLVSTNAGSTGDWDLFLANANANGCEAGASSFVCAEADPFNVAPTTGMPVYNWVFDVTYSSELTADAFTDAPIRAWFLDEDGNNQGLLSENVDIDVPDGFEPAPPIPTPMPLALIGIGGLMFGWVSRKSRA